MRPTQWVIKAVALGAAVCCLPVVVRAQQPDPADPRLKRVYHQLRFERMYPVESVHYIQDKLQAAPNAVPVLETLAQDERPEVRVLVTVLLGEVGDPDGAKTLWKLMRDDKMHIRMAAGSALLRMSCFTPVPINVEGLNDPDPDVRRWVAAVLGDLREQAAEGPLVEVLRKDDNDLVRREAARALGDLGTLVVAAPALIHALQDRSVLVRDRAAKSLGAFYDTTTIAALTEALKDEDWHVRASAAHSLSHWTADTPGLSSPLIEKLRSDEYALVRDRSAQALALRDDERAIDALIQSMISSNRDARVHAVETIVFAKAVLALPRLKEHEHHPNPEVREDILVIYGALGGADQLPAVYAALNDPEPAVRLAAVNALRKMQERGAAANLYDRLKDANPHVRAATARALGDLGDRAAVPRLVTLLRDDNGFVRSASAEALGKLGDRSAVPSLVKVLAGERPATEDGAAGGLVIGTEPGVLPEVAKLKQIGEKMTAVQALGELRASEALDQIIEFGLKAEDAGLRAESAVAIGKIGEPRGAGPLQEAVRGYYAAAPTKEVEQGVIATGQISDQFRQMKEREARVRASVAWALGQLRAAEALPILTQASGDENSLVRDAALEAIAKIHERQEQLEVVTP